MHLRGQGAQALRVRREGLVRHEQPHAARARGEKLPGNPYGGHTLDDQLQRAEALSGVTPTHGYVDRGDRGHGVTRCVVFISGQRRLSRRQKRALRRRSAIEPEIGHMKNDGLPGRCFLKGKLGM